MTLNVNIPPEINDFFFRQPQMTYVGRVPSGGFAYILLIEEPLHFIYRHDVVVPPNSTPEEAAQLMADAWTEIAFRAKMKLPTHPEGGRWTGKEDVAPE